MDRLREMFLWVRGLRDGTARRRLVVERARRSAESSDSVQELRFPGIPHPIWLRAGGDDYFTLMQVFVDLQYQHGLLIDPALIVDAGANIGLSAVFFANNYARAHVLAIEPDERNFELLLKNTAAYPNVQCLRGAVWPVESSIGIANRSSKNPASFQVRAMAPGDGPALRCYTPLSLLEIANSSAIDIFKIDIEGAELELFSCGSELWLDKVEIILAEIHDTIRPGCGNAFFHSICTRKFQYYQRAETTIIRFERKGD